MIAITVIVIFLLWVFKVSRRPANYPPGPNWWPIIGNMVEVYRKITKIGFHHLVWDDMIKQYGPIIGLKLGKVKLVVVSSKELIKEVSIRSEFEGRPDGYFWRLRSKGERFGIAFSDGPSWAELRKFSMLHLKKLGYGGTLMEDLTNEEIGNFIDWLLTVSNSPVKVHRLFTISVVNIVWAMLAGKRYQPTDKEFKKICDTMDELFRLLDGSGGTLQQFPFLRHIAPNASGYNLMIKNHEILWKYINDTIDEHKQTIKPNLVRDFIDAFLFEIEKNAGNENNSFTESQLMIICLDFLQAGSDTTSNSLEFIILFLIRHQDVQTKIYDEIKKNIGKDRKPSFQDRLNMPYTMAVLMEAQRLANIAPTGLPHRACQDTTLAGYNIPKVSDLKDTTIILHLYNMNTDSYWTDPFEFKPERFIDEDGNLINHDNFAPFGYGKRRCIGENMAKSSLFLFTTNIIKNFQILPTNIDDVIGDLKVVNGLSLSPKPFEVIWKPRTY